MIGLAIGRLAIAFIFTTFAATLTARAQTPAPQGAAVPAPTPPTSQSTPQSAGQTRQPSYTAVIRGRVTSAATGKPLRAEVTLNNAGDQPEPRVGQMAMTHADGRYEFTSLPEQRYQLTVSKPGYVLRGRGQAYLATDGGPIQLSAGQIVDHVDFALPRGGVIAGRITDEFGEPQGGIHVRAMLSLYLSGGRKQRQVSGEVSTNDLGEFRIYGLIPGTYIVAADMDEARMFMEPERDGTEVQIGTGNDGGSDDLATTYYPGTATIGEARTVTVDVSDEVSASLSLSPARFVFRMRSAMSCS